MGGKKRGHKMRGCCLEGQPLAALDEITGGINPPGFTLQAGGVKGLFWD